MAWLDWLEKKIGKFTIPHLIKYIIMAKALIVAASITVQLILPNSDFYLTDYLTLIPSKVMEGQVWRLVTFLIVEDVGSLYSSGFLYNLLMTAVSLYFYYFIGTALENRWGAFKFNLYYLIGAIAAVAGSFIFGFAASDTYLYETIFFAFAALFPDVVVRLFFFIPIKVKWIGIVSAGLLAFNMIQYALVGYWLYDVYILLCLVAFFIFFIPVLVEKSKNKGRSTSYQHRSSYTGGYTTGTRTSTTSAESGRSNTSFTKAAGTPVKAAGTPVKAFHRCYICGITEKDDPNMIFRYCSQCNGTYEYCSNHIQNHIHIQ